MTQRKSSCWDGRIIWYGEYSIMDILFDVGVSIVYNWLLLIGVLIGCIVAANNKKGMPFLWIGCAIQAVAVFGTVIGMRRDGLTTTGILCIVNYLVLTGLAFLLIDSIQDKAEKRTMNKVQMSDGLNSNAADIVEDSCSSEDKSNFEQPATEAPNNAAESICVPDEIRKFKGLLDDGIITQEEFDAKKKQLLGL